MSVFGNLAIRLIPFYCIIALGYIAGKKVDHLKEVLSKIFVYFITPVVVFYGVYNAKINSANLLIPVLFFIICSFISLSFYFIGKNFFKDSTKNIIALSAGTGNPGSFGLPLTILLFGDRGFSTAVFVILGFVLYINSVGFYIASKGNNTSKESFIKIIKLPSLYAFVFGVVLNLWNIKFSSDVVSTLKNYQGAYSVIGVMIVGVALSGVKIHHIDYVFLSITFIAKFIIWPLVILILIYIDSNYTNFYSDFSYKIFFIMSIVPVGVNAVAIATELKTEPNKAAVAVFSSTIFALFYIPLMIIIFDI